MAAEKPLLFTLAVLLVASTLLPGEQMEYARTALADGELWRLWTAQFCHWTLLHGAANIAAVAGLLLVGGRGLCRWLALLPLAAPLLSLFLLVAAPMIGHYRGLSGLVAMLVIGTAVEGGLPGRLLAGAWLAKLAFDFLAPGPSPLLPEGIEVAWQAHLGGLLAGLIAAAFFLRPAPRRSLAS